MANGNQNNRRQSSLVRGEANFDVRLLAKLSSC